LLHVATAHYMSPRWIEIQARYLRQHIPVAYRTWASLERIDDSYARCFDRTILQLGSHSGKLNHLAMEISQEARDDDLLMFLDGDAFPIADPMPTIEDALSRAPLLAVRRAENVDSPQPHPCFCVTTVGAWRSLPGDWSAGPTWPGGQGWDVSDVGSLLMRRLELAGLPWVQMLRCNRHNPDPLYFAVYGDVVYHHGAGFRTEKLTATHRAMAPMPPPAGDSRGSRGLTGLLARRRWLAWERGMRERLDERSRRVFERIERGGDEWLSDLI
jgi:hypothetical protein